MKEADYSRGLALLRAGTGNLAATFREGQWEAIAGALRGQAQLLVRMTGWGKSAVYFIAAKLIIERGGGPTIVVSPLLALMRNQIAAAHQFGLRATTVNTDNERDWEDAFAEIEARSVDILFASPEKLQNPAFIERITPGILARLGLLVVDEAHSISEWGHDFRPDYRRIVSLVRNLPPSLPILATTATANDDVVADVREQLGERVTVSRGPLTRETLILGMRAGMTYAERLAWLAEAVPDLPGSGIIYTLTKRDALYVAAWLRHRGIDAQAYTGKIDGPDREERERALIENRVKALVATSALGMGFDKADLGFVIHFQSPPSITAYYQQIGRAGRGLEDATVILLGGDEDDDIVDYFRRSALPAQEDVQRILAELEGSPASSAALAARINARPQRIHKALKFLSLLEPSPVARNGTSYVRTPVEYTHDVERVEALSAKRRRDFDRVNDYFRSPLCLMRFLAAELGDETAQPCGRCSVCTGRAMVATPSSESVAAAEDYLQTREIEMKPRKRWEGSLVEYGFESHRIIAEDLRPETGRAAAYWLLGRIGRAARREKYEVGAFSGATVDALVDVVRRWPMPENPAWVAAIPSTNRPDLVPELAKRVADRLGLPYVEAIAKVRATEEQKTMENSEFRLRNLDGTFAVARFSGMENPGIVIDDMYDSGWTMTVVAALLRRAGSGPIYPLTVVKASDRE